MVEVKKENSKFKDALAVAQEAQHTVKAKWSNATEFEATFQKLPEFENLVKGLANKGFGFTIDEVKKIAPYLDLASVHKAYEYE